MSYLEELETLLKHDQPRLAELIRLLLRMLGELREWIGRAANRMQGLDDRLAPIEDRLLLVDQLPAEAPFGALIRLRTGTINERATLYLGNGTGQPLTRVVPQPLV